MILSAGLSPAWQQILTFGSLTLGDVNRAATAEWCASGKVLNVGRAVNYLGGEGHTLCTVGGLHGDAIRAEFAVEGIPATWIETASPTRVCTTIVDQSQSSGDRITELVENAQPITAEELAAFEAEYARLAADADYVVLAGSLPDVIEAGRPVDLYRRLLSNAPLAILDVRGPELRAALPQQPLLVKPNQDELSATVGRPLPNETAVIAAMHDLRDAGAAWVLITDGPRPALLANGRDVWRFTPLVCNVVNPIGCGDCLAAGIAVALDDDAEMVEAVRFGMAASIENLRHLLPARLRLEEVRLTADDVTVTKHSH